jgi:hypothetical protein
MSKGAALSLEYQVKQKPRGDKRAFLENMQDLIKSKGEHAMVKLETAIRRAKAHLEKQEIYENFGQDEVRKIKDAYDYNSLVYGSPEERKQADKIDAFDDWCMNYTGPKNDPEPESFGPGM